MTKEASIIVPIFNEKRNIFNLANEIINEIDHYFDHYEIIIVDDGSDDNSLEELLKLKTFYSKLKILRHLKNYGQSAAILTGVRNANFQWIITLDGDEQNYPSDIKKLYDILLEKSFLYSKNLVVCGLRTKREDKKFRVYASHVGNKIKNFLFKDDCLDAGCGLKIFPKDLFLTIPHFNHLHRFVTVFFKKLNCEIINVPIHHRPRKHGKSKYTLRGRLKNSLYDIVGVKWLLTRMLLPKTIEVKQNVL